MVIYNQKLILESLNILNYRNIREARLSFAEKMNCFVGLNGQGKTNVLDAIYLLSFAKSAFTSQDSLNITHGEEMALVQGTYKVQSDDVQGTKDFVISCGLRKGVKKQFRKDKKDYPRLIDHIGLIPLVMISPSDQQLIDEGSDERRRFMDVVIHQVQCVAQTAECVAQTICRFTGTAARFIGGLGMADGRTGRVYLQGTDGIFY